MTEEEKDMYWQKAINDAKHLDESVQKTAPEASHMSDALVLTLQAIYTNDINEDYENWERDKTDLYELLNRLKAYTIKRNGKSIRISFTAEFDEILDILKEVLAFHD